MSFIPAEIIKKKRRGEANTGDEIHFLVNAFAQNKLPDYQMSAWAMAVCFQGMNSEETAVLTEAMKNSGRVLNFEYLKAPRVDKHSTGGVGDKTTLILGPIVAAAKVYIPMIAGRGLGHTGGTLDKLESIPGFELPKNADIFKHNIEQHYFALMGQTDDICPADKKFYALRDVTGTVDSLPLICGSIMSKKLTEGLTGLVLDVKYGSGAFMKKLEDARALASLLKETGEKNGVKVHALISNMNQPLGRFIGNSLEIHECLDILKGKSFVINGQDLYEPTRELSLQLAGHMIFLADKAKSPEDGYIKAKDILNSGQALEAFERLCDYQGGAQLGQLPTIEEPYPIVAPKDGYICTIDTEKIGIAALELGAGRRTSTDDIEMSAGLEFLVQLGWKVSAGDVLFNLYGKNKGQFAHAQDIILNAVEITESAPDTIPPLIADKLLERGNHA